MLVTRWSRLRGLSSGIGLRFRFAAIALTSFCMCLGQSPTGEPSRYHIVASSPTPATSIPFVTEDLAELAAKPAGKKLRQYAEKTFQLYEERFGAKPQTDLEMAFAITDWVAGVMRHPAYYPIDPEQPRYNPLHDPMYNDLQPDPLKMLEYTLQFDPEESGSWPSPQCGHQNRVAIGLLNAVGIHGRMVKLQLHTGFEFYSFRLHRWIYMDATHNEHYVLRDPGGALTPLGVRDLHELTKAHRLNEVEVVKHGYPGPEVVYLALRPEGFRRYAIPQYMKQVGEAGKATGGEKIFLAVSETSLRPSEDQYWSSEDPHHELTEPFWFRLNSVSDPALLDRDMDGLALVGEVKQTPGGIEFVLQSSLPYTVAFEKVGSTAKAATAVYRVDQTDSLPVQSPPIHLPVGAGRVVFRAVDELGNRSREFVIYVD